jgi:hypothetical protein
MNDLARIVLVHVLEEEKLDEQIINLLLAMKNKRKIVHNMFTA